MNPVERFASQMAFGAVELAALVGLFWLALAVSGPLLRWWDRKRGRGPQRGAEWRDEPNDD